MSASYGLIGYPLGHSFSANYFTKKFAEEHIDAVYSLFPISDIAMLPALLESHPRLRGLNVTIPYKSTVIPFLDETDNIAKEIGAVNCISIKNGKLKGYNTDVIGFEQSILHLLTVQHTNALVLGSGGSSKAVCYVLKKLGIDYIKVSRSKMNDAIAYEDITPSLVQSHKMIINTTPLGMYPNIDSYPSLPYESISSEHLLFDLVYNPAETKFLSLGKQKDAAIKNGLEMFRIQAEASWEIWDS